MAEPQWTEAFSCHVNTVDNLRQRWVEQGLEMALERKTRPSHPGQQVCDGEAEAKLIALR
ncbi:helix-turn-helix domain-containing protein [Leptolyngbya sp. PCC 6406]|uniref:helix-turn-helix domain-containing protein n=1 Tax=Leptolyngbya sp. PCC 6406 TaxID=1173264 RepID=UPI0002ACF331|nr:helix-turn-helix domain-containing protein [Leptolyngbya sp. PCC 6406]